MNSSTTFDSRHHLSLSNHSLTLKHPHDDPKTVFAKAKKMNLEELVDQIAIYRADIVLLEKKIARANAKPDIVETEKLRIYYVEKFKDEQMLGAIQTLFEKRFKQYRKTEFKDEKGDKNVKNDKDEKMEVSKEEESSYGSYFGAEKFEVQTPYTLPKSRYLTKDDV